MLATIQIKGDNAVLFIEAGFFRYEKITVGELGELVNRLRYDGYTVALEVER